MSRLKESRKEVREARKEIRASLLKAIKATSGAVAGYVARSRTEIVQGLQRHVGGFRWHAYLYVYSTHVQGEWYGKAKFIFSPGEKRLEKVADLLLDNDPVMINCTNVQLQALLDVLEKVVDRICDEEK